MSDITLCEINPSEVIKDGLTAMEDNSGVTSETRGFPLIPSQNGVSLTAEQIANIKSSSDALDVGNDINSLISLSVTGIASDSYDSVLTQNQSSCGGVNTAAAEEMSNINCNVTSSKSNSTDVNAIKGHNSCANEKARSVIEDDEIGNCSEQFDPKTPDATENESHLVNNEMNKKIADLEKSNSQRSDEEILNSTENDKMKSDDTQGELNVVDNEKVTINRSENLASNKEESSDTFTSRRRIKKTYFSDSDEDDNASVLPATDSPVKDSANFNVDQLDDLQGETIVKRKSKKAILSESEDDNALDSTSNIDELDDNSGNKIIRRKSSKAVFSDSEDENESYKIGKPVIDSHMKSINNDHDDDGDNITPRITALCDAESSDENHSESEYRGGEPVQKFTKSKPYRKSKPAKDSGEKEKKLTGKQAQQQRQEIFSESQRMLRESSLSLPYHKPKVRSLKEFLQNRPKFAASVKDAKAAPSLAMKMSADKLAAISKELENREKVLQEFYKSESESEDESDEENKQENEKIVNEQPSTAEKINENNDLPQEQLFGINVAESSKETNEDSEIHNQQHEQTPPSNKTDKETNDKSDNNELQEQTSAQSSTKTEDTLGPSSSKTDEETNKTCYNSEFRDASKTENLPATDVINPENQSEYQCETSTDVAEDVPLTSEAIEIAKPTFDEFNEDSMEFDFNLDGLDDELNSEDINKTAVEKNCDTEGYDEYSIEDNPDKANVDEDIVMKESDDDRKLQQLLKKYGGFDPPEVEKKLAVEDLLKKVGTNRPSLSGNPDEVIDLDEGISKPNDVQLLLDRFIKHTSKNRTGSKAQLDVINFTQGEITKETIAVSSDKEEPPEMFECPGVKLKKLREELQSQIAKRRSELWHQKYQEPETSKEGYEEECKDVDDDDEEEEILEDEEEEEEDNFADAEESNDAGEENYLDQAKESTGLSENEDENNEDVDEEEELETNDDLQNGENAQNQTGKKTFRKIRTYSSSDDEDQPILQQINKNDSKNDGDSLNSTDTCDNGNTSVNEATAEKTPCKLNTPKSRILELTPVQQLTCLQGFNSASKFLNEESPVSPFVIPLDPSLSWNTDHVPKKLFDDGDSQTIMDIPNLLDRSKSPEKTHSEELSFNEGALATQDLVDMCSGTFSATSSGPNADESSKTDEQISSKTVTSTQPAVTQIVIDLDSAKEVKELGDCDLISQLLNEEEIDSFKKKFESPVRDVAASVEVEEVQGGGRLLSDDSDDEDGGCRSKKEKKMQKRLAFSDDSDSEGEGVHQSEEEIDLQDYTSEQEVDDGEPNADVAYDSEENEIEYDEVMTEATAPKSKYKLSNYFEKEAELSDSDWDSADEDEKGLDALEPELGDVEQFDEVLEKDKLGKIHMRSLLDQDNREIKILQELLLEDGEMHGSGRQRQFRWKNIDNTGNDENAPPDGELDGFDEEESEEQLRISRYQRQIFLKKKQDSQDLVDDVSSNSDSQILKLGQEAVRRSLSINSDPIDQPIATISPQIKKPTLFSHTRGSFLSRTDKFLSRLATATKVNIETSRATTTTNVVFQSTSLDVIEASKKRKAGAAGGIFKSKKAKT